MFILCGSNVVYFIITLRYLTHVCKGTRLNQGGVAERQIETVPRGGILQFVLSEGSVVVAQ